MSHPSDSQKQLTQTQRAGHVAWCALVALRMEIHSVHGLSEAQQNLFLTRWLSTAHKQRRFHRDTQTDVEWLLKQGRQYGVNARLVQKLEYLWNASTGKLSEQNDLFRLKYAMETAVNIKWVYRILSDREWTGRHAVKLNPTVNMVLLSESSLTAAFCGDGNQLQQPLYAKITGSVDGMQTLLLRCGWSARPMDDEPHLYQLSVVPVQ